VTEKDYEKLANSREAPQVVRRIHQCPYALNEKDDPKNAPKRLTYRRKEASLREKNVNDSISRGGGGKPWRHTSRGQAQALFKSKNLFTVLAKLESFR